MVVIAHFKNNKEYLDITTYDQNTMIGTRWSCNYAEQACFRKPKIYCWLTSQPLLRLKLWACNKFLHLKNCLHLVVNWNLWYMRPHSSIGGQLARQIQSTDSGLHWRWKQWFSKTSLFWIIARSSCTDHSILIVSCDIKIFFIILTIVYSKNIFTIYIHHWMTDEMNEWNLMYSHSEI